MPSHSHDIVVLQPNCKGVGRDFTGTSETQVQPHSGISGKKLFAYTQWSKPLAGTACSFKVKPQVTLQNNSTNDVIDSISRTFACLLLFGYNNAFGNSAP